MSDEETLERLNDYLGDTGLSEQDENMSSAETEPEQMLNSASLPPRTDSFSASRPAIDGRNLRDIPMYPRRDEEEEEEEETEEYDEEDENWLESMGRSLAPVRVSETKMIFNLESRIWKTKSIDELKRVAHEILLDNQLYLSEHLRVKERVLEKIRTHELYLSRPQYGTFPGMSRNRVRVNVASGVVEYSFNNFWLKSFEISQWMRREIEAKRLSELADALFEHSGDVEVFLFHHFGALVREVFAPPEKFFLAKKNPHLESLTKEKTFKLAQYSKKRARKFKLQLSNKKRRLVEDEDEE